MKIKEESVYMIAFAAFTLVLLFIVYSKGTFDTGDSPQHYLIARYAIKYPHLLLDHWGKPLYILLSAPFAQAGYLGSNIYNLLCNTITAYTAVFIARELNFRNNAAAFILVFFSPLFFMSSFSALTEPTFALVLTISVYLILKEKYYLAAIIISFLPFARTEGFFIVPLFSVYLLLIKQVKAFWLTATGSVLYSLVGGLVFNDLLWIIHQNPYKGAYDLYGHGTLFYFVAHNDRLFGLPLIVLFVAACLSFFFKFDKIEKHKTVFFLLIFGSFALYFVMHSVFWWKGLFGSLGLHRVMAAVAPMFGIIALKGFNFITYFVRNYKPINIALPALILMAVIVYPFKQYHQPLQPNNESIVLTQAAHWIKTQPGLLDNRVYGRYSYINMLLNIDIFNANKYYENCVLSHPEFKNALKPGEIVFWDSHFGYDCGVDKTFLANIEGLNKIAIFNRKDISGREFEFIVYQME